MDDQIERGVADEQRIDPILWLPVGIAAVTVPVLWFTIGAAEADDLPLVMPAWAELVYHWLGREGVVGVFAAAGLFWVWLIAAARFPSVTTVLTLLVVEVGLVVLALRVGGSPGYVAGWAAAFVGSLMLPSARLRKVGSAVVVFGGAALGVGLAVASGGWCAAVGAAAVGAFGLWIGLAGTSRSPARPPG